MLYIEHTYDLQAANLHVNKSNLRAGINLTIFGGLPSLLYSGDNFIPEGPASDQLQNKMHSGSIFPWF